MQHLRELVALQGDSTMNTNLAYADISREKIIFLKLDILAPTS